jgi:hypothetical protein
MGNWNQTLETLAVDSRAAVVGLVIAALAGIFFKPLRTRWRRWRHRIGEDQIRRLTESASGINILEYGPEVVVDHASIKSVSGSFTLAIPLDVARALDLDPTFDGEVYSGTNIFGSPDLARLGEILGIADIEAAVQPHIRAIAGQFADRRHGISFNSRLIGVRRFRRTRIGRDERPYLSLDCYETDYFTFKVMDSLHRQLKQDRLGLTLESFRSDTDIADRLYPFLASIGLIFIVIGTDNKIVLSRRSRNLDRFGLKGAPIYPSFNEGLSWADHPARQPGFGHVPSIPRCVLRGLDEELGIQEREIDRTRFRLIGFGDVGIGFGVYGFVHVKLTSAEVVTRYSGPDRGFEAESFFSVLIERGSLNALLKNPDLSAQVAALIHALKADHAM